MDLNSILSKLETNNEEEIKRLLHQYNVEVGVILLDLTSTKTKLLASSPAI